MTASYPTAIREFTTKRNYLDIVWAEHMNSLQEEMRSIQETLGVVPQRALNNPGGVTRDHPNVAGRIQSVARGEQVPFFRGSAREFKHTVGTWHRPAFRADDDAHGMHTGSGIKLCEAGLWIFTAKADFKATPITTQQGAVRMLRLEVNGSDIGVRDIMTETPHNKAALHTSVTWVDTFAKDTIISLGIRTDSSGAPGELNSHCYLRAHLVRCHPPGDGGSVPFDLIPDAQPDPVTPTPGPGSGRRYTVIVRYIGGGGIGTISTGFLVQRGRVPDEHLWGIGKPIVPTRIAIDIVDDTSPAFATSSHPKFDTYAQAAVYRDQLWQTLSPFSGAYPASGGLVQGTIWADS